MDSGLKKVANPKELPDKEEIGTSDHSLMEDDTGDLESNNAQRKCSAEDLQVLGISTSKDSKKSLRFLPAKGGKELRNEDDLPSPVFESSSPLVAERTIGATSSTTASVATIVPEDSNNDNAGRLIFSETALPPGADRPGAYAGAPGTDYLLLPEGHLNVNPLIDTPQRRAAETTLLHEGERDGYDYRSVGNNPEVVADIVSDTEDGEIPVAEELTNSQNNRRLRHKRSCRRLILCTALGVGILVGVVLIAVFAALPNKEDEQGQVDLNGANATVTTGSMTVNPTAAPTEVGAYIESLLPNAIREKIQRSGSSQYQAFQWLREDPEAASYPREQLIQRFALATIFYEMGGKDWTKTEGWVQHGKHECEWHFQSWRSIALDSFQVAPPCEEEVIKNKTVKVYKHIWLDEMNMKGSLPKELFLLTSLKTLSMAWNTYDLEESVLKGAPILSQHAGFPGPLPTEIGLLVGLNQLFLEGNGLTGAIPSEVGRLTLLRSLNMSLNELTEFPPELGNLAQVQDLDLSLTNVERLPTEIGNLGLLQTLVVNEAGIRSLPTEVGKLVSLETLVMNHNFVETLPSEIGKLTRLKTLNVEHNYGDAIPSEIGILQELEYLNVNECDSYEMPTEIGQLTSLKFLDWSINNAGILPSEIGNLVKLKYLDLSWNFLVEVPTDIGTMTSLEHLDCRGNYLVSLPVTIGVLASLEMLDVADNTISSSFPTELKKLSKLTNLRIFPNSFTDIPSLDELRRYSGVGQNLNGYFQDVGFISTEIGLWTNLSILELSYTELTGTLPTELGLLLSLEALDVSGNDLSGTLPRELENLTQLTSLKLFPNEFSTLPTLSEMRQFHGFEEGMTNYISKIAGSIPSEVGLWPEIRSLQLGGAALVGTLPTEIGIIKALEYLDVSGNRLTGTIPDELQRLPSLTTLHLFPNSFSSLPSLVDMLMFEVGDFGPAVSFLIKEMGFIPSEIGLWTRLESLHILDSQLTGTLPTELGNLKSLEFLDVSNNNLSGTVPITQLSRLSNLRRLDLFPNSFSTVPSLTEMLALWGFGANIGEYIDQVGYIPSDLGLWTDLTGLGSESGLTGSLPTELGMMTSLTGMFLANNAFTGSVPSEVLGLPKLEFLELFPNPGLSLPALTDMTSFPVFEKSLRGYFQQIGSIPSEIGLLSNITELLVGDMTGGSIPTEVGLLTFLESLQAWSNSLTGTIPMQLFLLSNLSELRLSTNSISGTISTRISGLSKLRRLELAEMGLSGSMPTEVGLLTELREINLQNNSLYGSIPSEFGGLTLLSELSLHDNDLVGAIPTEIGLLTLLYDLRLSGNSFSGSVPREILLLPRLESEDLLKL